MSKAGGQRGAMIILLGSGYAECGPQKAALAPAGSLLELQHLRPHPSPMGSESEVHKTPGGLYAH